MNSYEVLRRPVITEKSTMLAEGGQYVFEVARRANKVEIRRAVEEIFRVHVRAVNVVRVEGKLKRMGKTRGLTASWKKAIVSLQQGDRIELFEGV
ncbi:MAG: 50S ribosomal protein L23 [Chloroflexi bacterium]|nr:50S ribosomal protein L23 [Chloroflexota bacterium]